MEYSFILNAFLRTFFSTLRLLPSLQVFTSFVCILHERIRFVPTQSPKLFEQRIYSRIAAQNLTVMEIKIDKLIYKVHERKIFINIVFFIVKFLNLNAFGYPFYIWQPLCFEGSGKGVPVMCTLFFG